MTDATWVGRTIEVEIERVAHGGHCVARHDGRVVFVRHAIPGERVLAEVTEDRGGSFCRADAIEILEESAERITAPCRYAGPGGCGGCDWQHVDPSAARRLKEDVVSEQLERLAGIRLDVVVQDVPPSPLRWRTRMQYAVAGDVVGLHPHRSDRVIEIDTCLIAAPGADVHLARTRARPDTRTVEVETSEGSRSAVTLIDARRRRRTVAGGAQHHQVGDRHYEVRPGGFWQVHQGAAGTLTEAVLQYADPQPGEVVLDLFCGVGLFTAPLAEHVGATGRVHGFEGASSAVRDGQRNVADLPQCSIERAAISAATVASVPGHIDVIVLDPPRTGAKRDLVTAICAREPRAVVYVACDPAALGRDVGIFREQGWSLAALRAFDLFPMTHHVECVALLLPPQTSPRAADEPAS